MAIATILGAAFGGGLVGLLCHLRRRKYPIDDDTAKLATSEVYMVPDESRIQNPISKRSSVSETVQAMYAAEHIEPYVSRKLSLDRNTTPNNVFEEKYPEDKDDMYEKVLW